MIDPELLQIICITNGVLLGMLGGWKFKFLRRYLMFAIFGLCGILAVTQPLNLILLSMLFGSITAHLPYGERTPYWLKAIVGVLIANSSCLMGGTRWQAIGSVLFILTFMLSNSKKYADTFFWKACEAIVWGCVGLSWARLIV